MNNIRIIAVGKIKEKYLQDGMNEYLKRLKKYANLEIIEVKDEKDEDMMNDALIERNLEMEMKRILLHIDDCYVIALAIEGEMLDSVQLADKIDHISTYEQNRIAFVIGGSNGLHQEIIKKARYRLSFSKLTFPHQLMRLIVLEQIYRAYKIMFHESYHK